MLKLKKLLQPDTHSSWSPDWLFLLVPAIWLSPYIFGLVASPKKYEYEGHEFVVGPLDWIGNAFGYAFMLFLVVVFVIALSRLIYRYRHRRRS
jgi:hypothetical protein